MDGLLQAQVQNNYPGHDKMYFFPLSLQLMVSPFSPAFP
jgi:hypothetical protein